MLKAENRLKNRSDFSKIYKYGKSYANRDFVVYYKKNDLQRLRVGFSVSRKVGKAWKRNIIKRRLREIIRNNQTILINNYDIIIIVRKNIKDVEFPGIEKSFYHVMKGTGLFI